MAKPAERSAARLAAVQALYQMDVSGKGVMDAMAEFEAFWIGREVEGVEFKQAENSFFRALLAGVVEQQRAIDPLVDRALSAGWPLTRVEAVLRAILRAGAYELAFLKDVPAKVVISEYVDVAHGFYGEDEPGLVNGVLDAIAREVRPGELGDRPGRSRPSRTRG
ncbi:transcription antitermination factor NusB [Enterovirga rhinocerotis]|uniref:Transcription antitermination protein NusB n=1 Tax=Enterovirga rhinocerotis TaxID=1339210 RepID=A0A4R7C6A1_9HYPH|nr:transcription antitermination factor NusB [Enterovirga rhinocerotis]TDR94104.1 NusB antitermination factor [Enterovirga rhinocerotis]